MKPYLVLALGIVAVSSAAILISFAHKEGVPAVAIAALRLSFASLILFPIATVRAWSEWRSLTRTDIALALLSGILLALHFAFWISSLDYTSVMSSVVLVSTNPLFVGLASVFLLREKLGRGTVIGIAIAALGTALIGLADLGSAGRESLWGDALALLGAVTVSGYLLIGRRLRRSLSLLGYIGLVYTTAAIVLLGIALAFRADLFAYSWNGYIYVLLLALGPQLIGHSSYNWALKYLSATFITITLLAEPIGATLLAIPLLAQTPSPPMIAGGALILIGIYLAAREETRTTKTDVAEASAEI